MNSSFLSLHEAAQEHAAAMKLGDLLMQAEHMRRFSQVCNKWLHFCFRKHSLLHVSFSLVRCWNCFSVSAKEGLR